MYKVSASILHQQQSTRSNEALILSASPQFILAVTNSHVTSRSTTATIITFVLAGHKNICWRDIIQSWTPRDMQQCKMTATWPCHFCHISFQQHDRVFWTLNLNNLEPHAHIHPCRSQLPNKSHKDLVHCPGS